MITSFSQGVPSSLVLTPLTGVNPTPLSNVRLPQLASLAPSPLDAAGLALIASRYSLPSLVMTILIHDRVTSTDSRRIISSQKRKRPLRTVSNFISV